MNRTVLFCSVLFHPKLEKYLEKLCAVKRSSRNWNVANRELCPPHEELEADEFLVHSLSETISLEI